jgi:LysR family transcriptional regulator, glycine cleavage system transcriptional activator
MRRYLPSLTTLQCFESSARHLSFTRAATELNLTQSAVSRQVQKLEETLNRDLFKRVKKRIVLTSAGKSFARDVRDLLTQAETITLRVMTNGSAANILNLGMPPSFGSRWLIPRLGEFVAAYPKIQVNLVTLIRDTDFTAENVDIAIWFGGDEWPDMASEPLLGERKLPVCAPSLIGDRTDLKPEDVCDYPLLQHSTRPKGWERWFSAHDIKDPAIISGPSVERFHMAIQVAVAGLGVGMFPEFLVQRELESGELVAPFGGSINSEQSYCIVYPEGQANQRKVKTFRDWIMNIAEAES